MFKLAVLFIMLTAVMMNAYAEGGEGISNSAILYSAPVISGKITNSVTGNFIPGAQVTLTTQGGATFQVTSGAYGDYLFQMLPPGSFNLAVTAEDYEQTNANITPTANCVIRDFMLAPSDTNMLQITDELVAYADEIVDNPNSYYVLSGNVNINGILFFSGQVTVDKRPIHYHPLIFGNCSFTAKGISGSDYILHQGNLQWKFEAEGDIMHSESYADFLETPAILGGFPLTMAGLKVDADGNAVYLNVVPKFPFPLDKVFEAYLLTEGLSVPEIIDDISFSVIYYKTQGIQYAGSVEGLGCDFALFRIEDLHVEFDTYEELFGGGMKLIIPGGKDDEDESEISAKDPVSFSKQLNDIPVILEDPSGSVLGKTSLGMFIMNSDAFGLDFLKVGVDIEFISGQINKLIINLGVKIPLASTGLFITEMTGGIEDMTKKDGWKIIANIDVETGLELPVVGSPAKLDDFGVKIHPLNYLQGSGYFEVFGSEVSDGMIEYDGKMKSLGGECNLDIADMIMGKSFLNLKYRDFNGGGAFTIKTPSDLPWFLNYLENMVLTSAQASIHNYDIWTQTVAYGISVAQRFEFGKQGFPWFHYYIGTDYDHLVQIWKDDKKGKSAIQFLVPENCPRFLIVAGDTLNMNHISFVLHAPDGKIYDSTLTAYHWFENTHQALMLIDLPVPGEWTFLSNYSSNLRVEPWFQNQRPSGLIKQPTQKGTASNAVSLVISDYADTLDVKVFYDTDREHFDGNFIQEFTVVNNADLDFEWQNDDVPDGEYFIYCMIEDGKNVPVMIYSPGSILVNHGYLTDVPQNVILSLTGDSLRVAWDKPLNPEVKFTTAYFEDLSTRRTDQITVTDTNVIFKKGLQPGQEYTIWCTFTNEAGVQGPESPGQDIVFTPDSTNNHKPYFTLNPMTVWKLIEGETSVLILTAGDADGNPLTFSLPGDTLGMIMSANLITWTPSSDQRGAFRVLACVTDGQYTDSTYVDAYVYSQEQVAVKAVFSSVNLYRNDNKFLKINNYRSVGPGITVRLMNLSTGDTAEVLCRKIDDFEYIGAFNLSDISNTVFPVSDGDSILLNYSFNNQVHTSRARYDSVPQPYDVIAPAPISDLQLTRLENNKVILKWNATGNDGNTGRAYKYDIRYEYIPVDSENVYMSANRIMKYPYPSIAGNTDSLVISMDTLAGVGQHDSVWFSIKAADEMQNYSPISNSPGTGIRLKPYGLTAVIDPAFMVHLEWDSIGASPFLHFYSILRKKDNEAFSLLSDSVTLNTFADDLYAQPDAVYTYAVLAEYVNGKSDTAEASPLLVDRFEDVAVLCQLEGTSVYDSVVLNVQGLDTVYSQVFYRMTNGTGLALMGGVYCGQYVVSISKAGYLPIIDTITVARNNSDFFFTLLSATLPRPVTGTITYANQQSTALGNILVRLVSEGGITVDSTLTDLDGNFQLMAVPGSYTLIPVCSRPWGGVNAVDGLQILRHFAGLAALESIWLVAGNVNGDASVNAIDAMLTVQRFAGLIISFQVGDWIFRPRDITVLPGQALEISVKGLCSGDVNGTYLP